MVRHYAKKRDKNERQIIDALEHVGATVYQIDGKGIPDLLVGWHRITFLIEVKTKEGKLTPAQVDFQEKWEGDTCETVTTPEEALQVLYRRIII